MRGDRRPLKNRAFSPPRPIRSRAKGGREKRNPEWAQRPAQGCRGPNHAQIPAPGQMRAGMEEEEKASRRGLGAGFARNPKQNISRRGLGAGFARNPKRITAEAQRQREKQVYISFSLRSLRPLREENLRRLRRNLRLAVQRTQREATLYLSFSATFAPSARGESSQHAKKLTVSSAENAEGEKRSRLHAEPSAAGALTGDFLFWFFRIPPVRAPAALGCLVPRLSCHNLQRYPAKDASEGKIGTVTYCSPRK